MNNRIYSINDFLQDKFGEKVIKLSIDAGFTCPNRDGTKGVGGCTFCSSKGSGEMTNTLDNINDQIDLLSKKWHKVKKYIAYFQSYTNTYKDTEDLRKIFEKAISYDKVVGLAIATRPDCLDQDKIKLLKELQEKTFIWVELGLQTIHEQTATQINRCYPLSCYDEVARMLQKYNIPFVTHLILGLPNETENDMIASVKYVCNSKPFGLKLHMLNIVKGSQMEKTHSDYSFFDSIEDYVSFVCDLIEIIPQDITIHRLNGDAPRDILISPPWSYKKRTILNGIHKELARRNSFQGYKCKNY